jgi:hypothetical protein
MGRQRRSEFSELHCSKYSSLLLCCYFLEEFFFDLLLLFSNVYFMGIWKGSFTVFMSSVVVMIHVDMFCSVHV